MKNFIVFGLVILTFISCRKDKQDPFVSGQCNSYGQVQIPYFQYYFEFSGPQYMKPSFNPNNPNEFVYNYIFGAEMELRTFNILTKEQRTLASTVNLASKPSWSSQGKIAFDDAINYHIWIIEENGNNLTQLSNNTANLFPAWSPDGNQLYYAHSPVLGIPYYLFSHNVVSEEVDTILNEFAFHNNISSTGIITSQITQGSSVQIGTGCINEGADFEYYIVVDVYESSLGSINSLAVSPSGNTVYITSYANSEFDGLFAADVNSGVLFKIKEHCLFNVVHSVDCSPDGKHLILERRSQKLEYSEDGQFMGRVLMEARLYLLDLQTGLEFPIDIP
jgi:Tol biopolymer transport system component